MFGKVWDMVEDGGIKDNVIDDFGDDFGLFYIVKCLF